MGRERKTKCSQVSLKENVFEIKSDSVFSLKVRDTESPVVQMCINKLTYVLVVVWFGDRGFHSGLTSPVRLLGCEGFAKLCAAAAR